MMVAQKVVFNQAVLNGSVKHTVKEGSVVTTFLISGPLTIEAADMLGCKALLYGPDGLSNTQYRVIALRPIEESLRVTLEPEGLSETLNVLADRCDPAVSAEDGGLSISAKFAMTGDEYAVIEFLKKAGNAPCRFVIEKQQERLDLEVAGADAPESQGTAEPTEAEEKPKPARRGRKPKAESAPIEQESDSEGPPDEENVLVHFTRIGV